MAEAREGEAGHQLSPRIRSYARDLLRRFSGSFRAEESQAVGPAATEEDSGEVELSLGLSLGGCFGVDPAQKRGLVRSSSVAALPFLQRGEPDPAAVPVLARTCSLPVETEEEQRKRKELQCLRRMEAKRKRSEKRNSSRSGTRAAAPAEEGCGGGEEMQQDGGGEAKEGKVDPDHLRGKPAATWAARAAAWAAEGARCPASQGSSVGSQGSSSSGVSDFNTRPPTRQGSGVATESRVQPNTQQPPSLADSKAAAMSYVGTEADDPSKKAAAAAAAAGRGGNGMRDMMEEMPCVSTMGGGPGGRKVEGFLYRYRKGEEVRIMCVCHGSFFSPAEFVKHAGGGDVAHPLRHIVVNPSPPSSFL